MLRAGNLIGFGTRRFPGTWLTNAQSSAAGNNSGWNGFTMRQVIQAAGLANTGGSRVRVTFQATSSGNSVLDNAYIGHAAAAGDAYDFEATPTQLFFNGGNAGITMLTSTTAVTDEVAFVIQPSKALIISMHFSAASGASAQATLANWQAYFKSGSDAATVNATGYSTAAFNVHMIKKVESLF